MLCTHKTTILCQFGFFVTSLPPYLRQFSAISGGNCITRYSMRKHFKSRFPAFNIPRRSEEVTTDTIFSETPATDSGVTMAFIFVGKRTLVTDVYPSNPKNKFVNKPEENIRFRGAMTKIISDYAKVEISNKVMDIHRMYHRFSWSSESYHQNQNPAEGRYCTLKRWTNTI